MIPGRKKYAPPVSVVKAGIPLCTLRIGRLGTVKSRVPSWVPQIGIVLVAEFVEGLVVDPDVLGELELAHQARTDDERGDAPVHAVVGSIVGQRGPVGRPAPDHPAPVHAVSGIARIEPPACDPSGHA